MVTRTLPPPQVLTSDRLLAAEGLDKCNFFAALMKQLPLRDVQIRNVGGNIKFDEEFEALQRMEGFDGLTAIGVVRDAEQDPAEKAFKSVFHTLEKFGLTVPHRSRQGQPCEGSFRGHLYYARQRFFGNARRSLLSNASWASH